MDACHESVEFLDRGQCSVVGSQHGVGVAGHDLSAKGDSVEVGLVDGEEVREGGFLDGWELYIC